MNLSIRKPFAVRRNDRVKLSESVPYLMLKRGDVGVVRSAWGGPDEFYEVEFDSPAGECPTRVVLSPEQLEDSAEECGM